MGLTSPNSSSMLVVGSSLALYFFVCEAWASFEWVAKRILPVVSALLLMSVWDASGLPIDLHVDVPVYHTSVSVAFKRQ